eukprot:SAG22_NODE_6495_length_847_cov_1.300802_1_plen_200_part_01
MNERTWLCVSVSLSLCLSVSLSLSLVSFLVRPDLGTVIFSREGQGAISKALQNACDALWCSQAASREDSSAAAEAAGAVGRLLDVEKCGKLLKLCNNCGAEGHFSSDCPEDEWDEGGGGGASAGSRCFWCGEPGHLARDCPSNRKGGRAYTPPSCYRCGQVGHISKDCKANMKLPPGRPHINQSQQHASNAAFRGKGGGG